MKTINQKYKSDDGTEEYFVTHLFSENGYFTNKDGKPCGWHIQLGTNDSEENYAEVIEEAVAHLVPTELPELTYHKLTEEEIAEIEKEIEAQSHGIEERSID